MLYRSSLNKVKIIELFDSLVAKSEVLPLIGEKEEVAELLAQGLFDAETRCVELSIAYDSDSTCCLKAYADIDGFSGYGEGWFNGRDLFGFVGKLENRDFPVVIEGGYYGPGSKLRHVNLGLKFTEVGCGGIYRLHITLKNHPYAGCDPEEIMCFSSKLMFGKAELNHFVDSFKSMISNGDHSFIASGN
ncbi:hypothetical protein [Pseudoteredinibacter isoporae]|uniref:hypothetical protein n=1 Tax=Pseudoteredinibacter isoporae TaxID=570281 RepID=UPI00141F2365|nr:hypothetical protein [Pseudoteredinibacter isoporae]NHO88489.1 hypothetical protein [Pseudoteredinibacter isoporae]NIB22112.1 hypothetical protein [Pseudoteredinibacter isoporae]